MSFKILNPRRIDVNEKPPCKCGQALGFVTTPWDGTVVAGTNC